MMRRSLLISLFVLIANTASATPPVNPADAIAFMNRLWNQAVELLNNKPIPR